MIKKEKGAAGIKKEKGVKSEGVKSEGVKSGGVKSEDAAKGVKREFEAEPAGKTEFKLDADQAGCAQGDGGDNGAKREEVQAEAGQADHGMGVQRGVEEERDTPVTMDGAELRGVKQEADVTSTTDTTATTATTSNCTSATGASGVKRKLREVPEAVEDAATNGKEIKVKMEPL